MSADTAPAIQVLTNKLQRVHGLSEDDRVALERLPVHEATVAKGQDIVGADDLTDRCAIVLSGMAFSYKLTGQGRRQILSVYLAGDLPDLQSLWLGRAGTAVAAMGGCCVGHMSRGALKELCVRRSSLANVLWRETLFQAALVGEWLLNVGRRDARARLAHLMCEMVLRHRAAGLTSDQSCSFPLDQVALADALGISTVHVNRSLQKLRRDHLVETKDRRLTVLDWERLCRIAEFDPVYLYLAPQALAP